MIRMVLILIIYFNPVFAGEVQKTTIASLRASDWVEVERYEEKKKLPGLGRYKKLTRIVHITRFIFKKNGEKKSCWILYDSQLDKVRENCRLSKNK